MSNRDQRVWRNIAPKPPATGDQSATPSTPSEQAQPITPARPLFGTTRSGTDSVTSSSGAQTGESSSAASRGGSGSHTLVACTACRKRKTKCDGRRPVCTSCINKSTACEYVAEEKESHISALKRKNNDLMEESEQLRYLVNYLIQCPEEDAIDVVRHLRRYQDVAKTIDLLKDSSLLLPLSQASPRRNSSEAIGDPGPSIQNPYRLENAQFIRSGPNLVPPESRPISPRSMQAARDDPASRGDVDGVASPGTPR